MLKKCLLLVCDGLGDRPIEALGNLTPLEAARTPNLDSFAAKAECGVMVALGRGKRPGSDTSHLAILGYDPAVCYSGRGPIEVAGIGLKLQDGDIAFRGNFGTVDDKLVIKDRRGGRIRDVGPLASAVDGMAVEDVSFLVKPGTAHRAGVVMRGKGLSDAITDADPHEAGVPVHHVQAKDDTPQAKKTARVLNEFMRKAYEVLRDLPFNADRQQQGQIPVNFLLLRGPGQYRAIEPFASRYGMSGCCIAGGGLYKGIGALLGMELIEAPAATGLPDTDVRAKFEAALAALASHDFVFVHVKAADSLGEDGNYEGKKAFIEKIDQAAAVLVQRLPQDVLFVATADHTTPCALCAHSADAVPVMFSAPGVRADSVKTFGERSCASGILGMMSGLDVMPHILNLLGRLALIGA